MFSQSQYVTQLQGERRRLAVHNQQLERSHKLQKQKADQLGEIVKEKEKQIRELERDKKELIDALEKARLTIDSYKRMLFQAGKDTEVEKEEQTETPENQETLIGKKKPGQKKGHTGYGRKNPETIDRRIACFLSFCPDCGEAVVHSGRFRFHIVTDIPEFATIQPTTTEYQIEKQWCGNCKKEVAAVPYGVLPGARFGINLFLMVLVWRYHLRLPFNRITQILLIQYNIPVSEGALVGMLKRARQFFGKKYDMLVSEIRGSPVKHADETSWRVNGETYWCWIFLTSKSVYYTIEETRGKGIPERILKDAIGVLVRDGYGAYGKLPLVHQACFAHPYRKARDAAQRKGASEEVKKLFLEIKILYGLIAEDVQKPFDKTERLQMYGEYKQDLAKIAKRTYQSTDAKQIQTYVNNLGENLLTALLYKDVPLTNNPAEQAARQIVVGRKISGGSRSAEGAKVHAVNMSITQTILKQKLPLLATLQTYTLEAITKTPGIN